MSKKATRKTNDGPHVFWRNGRAYADLRAYADVGGDKSPLALPGATWGTTDQQIAEALFAAKLADLQAKRAGRVGIVERRTTTLAEVVRDHLLLKAKAGKTSHGHLGDLEQRLSVALDYFGAGRDPRTIEPSDVREWAEDLASDGNRMAGTVRHYLNAVSGLYGRAQESLYVDPAYNPVAEAHGPVGGRGGFLRGCGRCAPARGRTDPGGTRTEARQRRQPRRRRAGAVPHHRHIPAHRRA
jgi:hypothetical protein